MLEDTQLLTYARLAIMEHRQSFLFHHVFTHLRLGNLPVFCSTKGAKVTS